MSGSIDISRAEIPLSRTALVPVVMRWNADVVETDEIPEFEFLPNIRVLEINYREGAEPGQARFRYSFGDPMLPGAPQRFEQVYPLNAPTRPGVVKQDDRIVVRLYRPDGKFLVIFSGFVQVPQVDLGPSTETVTFEALGDPVREWDHPVHAAWYRHAHKDDDKEANVVTQLPVRFNPDGKPNRIKEGFVGEDSKTYPIFLDWRLPVGRCSYWSLGDAVAYLCRVFNKFEGYVKNPSDEGILPAKILGAQKTNDKGEVIDGFDPIVVRDVEATGDAWPEAVWKLIDPFGFGMRFFVRKDEDSDKPVWRWEVYRKDDQSRIKSLHLQKSGAVLNPAWTNVGELALSRDTSDIANTITVLSEPVQYQVRIRLSPLFEPGTETDSSIPARDSFTIGNSGFTGDNINKYRLFGMDEACEGVWSYEEKEMTTDSEQRLRTLKRLFGQGTDPVLRRRPPVNSDLFERDELKRPRNAKLMMGKRSDPSNMQEVKGGWRLCDDRFGIYFDCDKAYELSLGENTDTGRPFDSNKVDLIKACTASTKSEQVELFLFAVIESDNGSPASAPHMPGSLSRFAVERIVDGRDRYKKHVIFTASGTGEHDEDKRDAVRDDTSKAKEYATALRRAHENGTFSGSATIPRFTAAYEVGDKIDMIRGRNVGLQINVGDNETKPVYPTVVGITYNFDGQQSTTLQLSDRRAEQKMGRTR